MIDVRHMKKLFLWMLLTAGCNPKKNMEHRAVTSFARLACPRMFLLGQQPLNNNLYSC